MPLDVQAEFWIHALLLPAVWIYVGERLFAWRWKSWTSKSMARAFIAASGFGVAVVAAVPFKEIAEATEHVRPYLEIQDGVAAARAFEERMSAEIAAASDALEPHTKEHLGGSIFANNEGLTCDCDASTCEYFHLAWSESVREPSVYCNRLVQLYRHRSICPIVQLYLLKSCATDPISFYFDLVRSSESAPPASGGSRQMFAIAGVAARDSILAKLKAKCDDITPDREELCARILAERAIASETLAREYGIFGRHQLSQIRLSTSAGRGVSLLLMGSAVSVLLLIRALSLRAERPLRAGFETVLAQIGFFSFCFGYWGWSSLMIPFGLSLALAIADHAGGRARLGELGHDLFGHRVEGKEAPESPLVTRLD